MRAPTVAGDVRPTLANINSAWTRLPAALSDWQPHFPGADWTLRDTYRQGENEVDVFVAFTPTSDPMRKSYIMPTVWPMRGRGGRTIPVQQWSMSAAS
jgi:hypothetical protein